MNDQNSNGNDSDNNGENGSDNNSANSGGNDKSPSNYGEQNNTQAPQQATEQPVSESVSSAVSEAVQQQANDHQQTVGESTNVSAVGHSNETAVSTEATASLETPEVKEEIKKFVKPDIKGKKVLVVGLGRTGIALVKLLVKLGADVTISDHKSKAELIAPLEILKDLEITYDLGGHSPKLFVQQDFIVLSPGISPSIKIFDYAKNHGVKVTGEFEFVSKFIEEPIIAVTGTNGKTTTCILMLEMLKKSGVNTWLGGNFGAPLSEYLLSDNKADVLIAEVSSFQLEHVEEFDPRSIVFMNLAENHLDRYKSMEEYINAKRRIFSQTNQYTTSILNADDNAVVELARDPQVQKGLIFYFSRKEALEPQIMNIGGAICIGDEVRVRTGPEIEYFNMANMKMRGRHSIENVMAAIIASRQYGANHDAIQSVIDNFRGMPHRIEYVRKVGGVQFYNDSKATNVHAVVRALSAFDENVILIMGGKDTNLNYEPIQKIIRQKVKTLILVGESKERINRHIGDSSETFLIGTFEEAVLISYQKSRNGDKVLLSPGCSSFDFFDSYVERGNYFKEIVNQFK